MPEVELPLTLPVFTSAATGASILVIDDEAAIRESLEVLLTLEGYAVKMAVDGEQGLRALDTENLCCSTLPCRARAAWSYYHRSKTGNLNCRSS